MLKIAILAKLNLTPNYIYETIVTTYNKKDKTPNAAPMGIKILDDQNIVISPFLSTQTHKNIEKYGCAVINFIYDLEIFFESTFNKKRSKLPLTLFENATNVDAPRLKEAIAHIEIRVREVQKDSERSNFFGEIVACDFSTIPFHPLNRGYNLVLESMVHATRIITFKKDTEKVKNLINLIEHYRKLVKKVAPTGKFVNLMDKIQNIIKKG
ncbi:MAG: DUF447 family protein [Candidatus Helarchaeota archaeon]|nr:DUF447 family protein [Candidatus Helarchaeota archaeon]